jgi:CRP-like cAMP-binding protein
MARPTSSPHSADRAAYAAAMRAISPLGDEDVAEGIALSRVRVLAKGEHLLLAGARATEIAVVTEGLLREYFVIAGGGRGTVNERTKAFITEAQVSGSLADILSGSPSRAFIVADEPTRLLVARYADHQALALRSPAWAALGRAGIERLLLAKAEREWELLGLDADSRYDAFRRRFPGLEARVAARHVASYLGITAVHLSRLRGRRRAARAAHSAPRSPGSR